MNHQALIDSALELGFSAAAVIPTTEIIFRPEFRVCCEDNSCGMYGVNYACPPACGTTEEMKERVLAHKKAFVLQTIWEVPDLEDKALLKKDKKLHNTMIRELVKSLPEECKGGFMIAASGCSICPECSIVKNEPCRFPDLKTSCVSAYCIYVQELAERLGWDYDLGQGLVAYFGMYIFD
ncbi:MAG: DUF2284 domain-containing protein [Lachnospiraceae bacterium]|nr:DUF2284 domain-containing protein [Lachnospiraceae bacterium]